MRVYNQFKQAFTYLAPVFYLFASAGLAHADAVTFTCSFVEQHSSSDISAAMTYTEQIVGTSQANSLYGQYIGLKNECRSNPSAKRSVSLSPEIAGLVANR
jgi:hypothetical protein